MSVYTYPDLEQGTEEWRQARAGIITASVIGSLITPGTIKAASNETSRALTVSLAAERITGHVEPIFVTDDMMRGHEEEPLARAEYEQRHQVQVAELGFMVREHNGTRVGYSPDGLVGDDGLIEVKSRKQKKHVRTVLDDAVPVENMAQLQCGLWVTGRDWIDYLSYSAGMAMWEKRVTPDPRWFAAIEDAATKFEEAATAMVATYTTATHGLPLTKRHALELTI